VWWGELLKERRVPALLISLTVVAASTAVVLLTSAGWVEVLVAAATGLVVLNAAERRRRRQRLYDLLAFRPRRRAGLKPSHLGVKPSAIARDLFRNMDPPYVHREQFDDRLDTALRTSRFVVVKGLTNSGKTRAVFEAIGRVLPTHKVVVPKDPTEGTDAVGRLLRTRWLLPRRGRYVVVVNDLETRISTLQGFAVRKWLKAHPRSLIVATLSAEHWADLLAREPTSLTRSAGNLMDVAAEISLSSRFRGQELEDARRLYELPEGEVRLGAYLAAADRAIEQFDATAVPRYAPARALALSGINCARAGLVRPIALDKLVEMSRRVTSLDGAGFSDAEWDEAIRLCVNTKDRGGGILEESALSAAGGERAVIANPVLIEIVDRGPKRDKTETRLPDHVWSAITAIVADGPFDLLRIATAAGWRGNPDLAEALLREIAAGGGFVGGIAAARLKEPDRLDELPQMTDFLARVAVGKDINLRRPPLGRPRVRHPPEDPPKDPIFDPSIQRSERWYSFYRLRAMRDAVRFSILLFCDVFAVGAGIFAAQRLSAVGFPARNSLGSSSLAVAFVAAGFVLIFFLLFGLYRADRERARLGEIIKSMTLAATALAFWVIGSGYALVNVPLTIAAAAIATGLAFLFRWIYDLYSRRWVKRRGLQSRALLITPSEPRKTAELILNGCRRPMQLVGYLSERPTGEAGRLGSPVGLEPIAAEHQVDRVIIGDPNLSPQERQSLIYQCHALDLATDIVPTSAELFQGASDALDDMAVPLINVRPLYLNYVDKTSKRVLDLVVAIPLSVIALVLIGPILLSRTFSKSKDSPLTVDYRPGLAAVAFPMWRLRTEHNGEASKFDRFLERFRVDELPQLLNVLSGTMSLVGPRPLSLEEFDGLDDYQRARYAVLPGITGLWQVARRKESSLGDMCNLDVVYSRKWTPLLDLTILLRTIPAVLAAPAKTPEAR
jgi:lipopolysaccharide/colanic/teichoic acid biosynthesis glycosyltransferase